MERALRETPTLSVRSAGRYTTLSTPIQRRTMKPNKPVTQCKCGSVLWFWKIKDLQVVLTCSNCGTKVRLNLGASLGKLLSNLEVIKQ